MEQDIAEILSRALASVSVRMADGTRDPAAQYCEQCAGSGLHGAERRCGCWCHAARAALAEKAASPPVVEETSGDGAPRAGRRAARVTDKPRAGARRR